MLYFKQNQLQSWLNSDSHENNTHFYKWVEPSFTQYMSLYNSKEILQQRGPTFLLNATTVVYVSVSLMCKLKYLFCKEQNTLYSKEIVKSAMLTILFALQNWSVHEDSSDFLLVLEHFLMKSLFAIVPIFWRSYCQLTFWKKINR